MQAQLIDHVRIDSPLHRVDARWKLAAVVPAIAAVVALHTLPAAGLAFAAACVLLVAGRLPLSWFLARLGGVAFLLGLFAVLLPLTTPGDGDGIRVGPLFLYF